MKLSVFTSVLLAGLVAAQEKLPKCAQPCVDEYTTGGGVAGCGQLDVKCICSNKSFLSGIACCLEDKCNASDQETAVKYAKQICSTAGVTNLPDQVTCDKSAASGSASGTTTPTSSASSSQTTPATSSAGGDSGNAAAREGAAGVLGVVLAMLFAL
ncbi:CFEM domain-containing protein [Fusarium mexicanum]|uniref:CFEM domain-containing protein n=1 Tax=Fusarium mexicanum TaxID=751941 RepID=A0A8H5J0C7_9HYPO|nr:CFEM domain-containing protein [Fusarium mexicanum]